MSTLSQLIVRTADRLSMVAGTGVQTYAEDRIAEMIQHKFDVLFDEVFWPQFLSWAKLTLDGTLADDAVLADFIVTTDKCAATSVVIGVCSLKCHIDIHTVVSGSFKVSITNKSGGTLADDSTMVLNYVIL